MMAPLSYALGPLGRGRAVAGGPPLTNLVGWWKPDSLAAGALATWPAAGGTTFDLTQPTGARQPVVAAGIFNGYAGVRFTATAQQYLQVPDVLSGATAGTIFAVLKLVADPPAVDSKTGLWAFNNSNDNSHHPYTDGTIYEAWGTTARKTVGNPVPSMASPHLYAVRSAAGDFEARINGSTLFSTAGNTAEFTSTFQRTVGLSRITDGLYYLDGWVAEILVYNAAITGAILAAVELYLNGKYSIY